MRKTAALTVILICFCCFGCAAGRTPESGDALNVVCTIFPAYDFARAIAGEKADITMLIRAGASVHSYDPSPADIIKISEADIFVYIGGENEEWVERVLSSVESKTAVRLMDYVEPIQEDAHHHDEPEYDEHIWTSPENAAVLVDAVAAALCAADSKNAESYRKNADAYMKEIKDVGAEIAEAAENGKRKKIVMADRFALRYLTEEYGLKYDAAFGGCDDQSDASVATIVRLVNTIRNEAIPYVFYAELSNGNTAKAVAGETGAGLLRLTSCQNVTKDELEAGETYVSLMRQNAENLKKGLN